MTVRDGVGVLSGDFSLDQEGGTPTITAFAIAAVAGSSSRQVFRWLDVQANRLFSVATAAQTVVPDLRGKTREEAGRMLKSWRLSLGTSSDEAAADEAGVGKVVGQSPAPGSVLPGASAVDVRMGVKTE